MVLALVVLAGTSAMAQTDPEVDNTATLRYTMITGSTHTFSLTPGNAANTINWRVWKEGSPGAEATTADIVSYAQGSTASYQITWAHSASGNYYVQYTETRPGDASCAVTIRRFYIQVFDFDVEVFISDASGAKITGTDNLAECGEGTVANYGDMPADGSPSTKAFSNDFNSNGDLVNYKGETSRTTRYVSLKVTWNVPVGFTAPTIGSMKFNYVTTSSAIANGDLITVNGSTDVASGETSDAVNGDGLTCTFPLVYNARWGQDITTVFNATNVKLYTAATPGTTLPLGLEPQSKEVPQGHLTYLPNTTEQQTIYGAPATTVIGVSQNEQLFKLITTQSMHS